MSFEKNFREIVDDSHLNNGILLIIVRAVIRYSTRFFGINTSIKLSKVLISIIKIQKRQSYTKYVLQNNIFRNEYYKISRFNLIEGHFHKIKWAKFLIGSSKDRAVIANAKEYLSVTNNYTNSTTLNKYEGKKISNNDNLFYIYGPNTDRPINSHYKNSTLINLKPLDFDKHFYKSSILFVNSYYYRNFLSKDKIKMKNVLNVYDQIFLCCNKSKLNDGIKRLKIEGQGYIASLMGLGRILYYLSNNYENVNCVIEGFDFYLKKEMYKNYYHKVELKDQPINNEYYIYSLLDHDALYNFLYVKNIVSRLNLIDSKDIKEILKFTGNEYLKHLQISRME